MVTVDVPPLHKILVETPVQANVVAGCVIVNVRMTTQAFASFMFIV